MLDTAMILCAGFGTRLGELTRDTPKPMLEVNKKPILEYTINHLKSLGINNLVINLHYLHERITDYFGDGSAFGVRITYSYEDFPLGTAGAVLKVKDVLEKKENFMLLYGDVLCNQNYLNMHKLHKERNAVATIVLHERNKSNSVVEMDDENKIVRFIERPDYEVKDKKQNWVNSGLYCFSNKIFDYFSDEYKLDSVLDFPKNLFEDLVINGNMYGYPLNGYRCAVDSVERYEKLKEDFSRKSIF